MNYLNGELNYEFNLGTNAYFMYNDNTIVDNGPLSGDVSIRDYIYNFATQNEKVMPLMVYLPRSTSKGYLFFNVNLDYIYFHTSSYQLEAKMVTFDETQNLNSLVVSPSPTYLQTSDGTNLMTGFESLYYEEYIYGPGDQNSTYSVFDCSFMEYYFGSEEAQEDLTSHVFNAYGSKPDNSLYYKYCLEVQGYALNNVTMNILHADDTRGHAIYESWETAYETGYSHGYGNGYGDGYADGYNQTDSTTANAFGYIGQAFEAVSNVLAIQVLPHITLGLVFSIPLTFTLIMLVFKLVKK